MRYLVTLSYDGAAFCGWQIQPNAKTVQESLEKSLSTLLKTDISVVGAGRTDSKVNAIGYVAHFDCETPFDTSAIGYKLNAILPAGIVVHSLAACDGELHARFSATKREYTYFLHRKKDPFAERFSYECRHALDIDAMNEAAALLLGRHDFSCFEKTGADNKTSICTVKEAFWAPYSPMHASLMGFPDKVGDEPAYLYFRISADRFLRNMVRAVVGSLLEVGRGRRSIDEFADLLDKEKKLSRSDAGESVPGHALFLSRVEY